MFIATPRGQNVVVKLKQVGTRVVIVCREETTLNQESG